MITMCHGVRGEVKVQPLTDSPKRRFGRKGARWVRRAGPSWRWRRAPR